MRLLRSALVIALTTIGIGLATSGVVGAVREGDAAVDTDPTGARIPADKKSVAYSLTYRSGERTLTADEVNAAHARLKERLKTALSVTLRE